jgi:hypothetical protein
MSGAAGFCLNLRMRVNGTHSLFSGFDFDSKKNYWNYVGSFHRLEKLNIFGEINWVSGLNGANLTSLHPDRRGR